MSEAGEITPVKYEITLTPEFYGDFNLNASVNIHVNVTDSVKQINLKMGENLNVTKVTFQQAAHIFRGRAQGEIQPAEFVYDNETQILAVTLYMAIDPESIKEEGFLTVEYNTIINEKNDSKGIYRVNDGLFETDLKDDNAQYLFPVLGEDVPVSVDLSVITPYRAGVDTDIPAGEHKSVQVGEESLFSNNFKTGDEKVKLSDIHFKIHAPTPLILD